MTEWKSDTCRKVAHYGNVSLKPRLNRALALFRLGVAPLNRNSLFSTCISSRICPFCSEFGLGKFIEDEYHVCFECKLYESLRCSLLQILTTNNFCSALSKRSGSNSSNTLSTCPLFFLAHLLNVSSPSHVRCVSQFLCDCLSLRVLFLENLKNMRKSTFRHGWLVFDSDRKKLRDSLAYSMFSMHASNANSTCESAHLLKKLFAVPLPESRLLLDFLNV
jgi:hypothetical protein